jgi:hypothetical protein
MCTHLSTHVKDSSALPAFPLHHRLDSDIYPVAPQDQLAAGGQIKLKRIAAAGYKIRTQSDGDNHDDDDDDHHHHADADDADGGDDDDVQALDAHDATVDGGGDDAMMLLLMMMMTMMISEYHFIPESCSICF